MKDTNGFARNGIIAQLDEVDQSYLLRESRPVHLEQQFTFYELGEIPRYIYFLTEGMASEVVRLGDGRLVDGSPVGRDAFVGVPALLQVVKSHHHCVMQVEGDALRVPAELVLALMDRSARFRTMAQRFVHARFVQATQCAACNLLHTMEQRLARWLLVTCQHTGSTAFQITHEYIAEMLGANRTTVSLRLGTFQRAGLIDLDRELIRIRRVEELRSRVCECYGVIAEAFDAITAN
jgi:CRP-like cAMP-binding protein